MDQVNEQTGLPLPRNVVRKTGADDGASAMKTDVVMEPGEDNQGRGDFP